MSNRSIATHAALAWLTATCVVPVGHAQVVTLTATATVKGAGGASVSAPLTLEVARYATDAERDALMAAVKTGGTEAARAMLAKRADAGVLQVGGRRTPIKYAYSRPTGARSLITVITAEPIAFVGAGLPGAKATGGFELGLLLLDVGEAAPGEGELVPAAKVRLDAQNAIVTEDYNASEVVRITNVVRK
jgi:hypothetical protein